ncbi:uncharacterized protein LOC122860909 [Aphidius gifuensis]|uniref:uncharacterized protein LOC122860909 n=1 Tax=Aphidius gifuensis TaxID=684658 RepID=UPI001CDD1F4C|nr:uncharacterized protein LOC122860909 [Aphidius gifuensis]
MNLYFISLKDVLTNGFNTILVHSSPMSIISDALGVGLNFLTILIIWIIAITQVVKIKEIIQKFNKTNVSLNNLGIDEAIDSSIRLLMIICIVVNIIFYIHYILNNIVMYWCGYNTYQGWFWFDLGLVIGPNALVIFITSLLVLKKRFKKINRLIIDLPGVNSTVLSRYYEPISHLKAIGQVHSDLKELLSMISNLFSLPLIILLSTNFMEFAACGYMAYNKFKDDEQQKWQFNNIVTVLALMSWVILHFCQMFFLIDSASSTVKEANETGNILHQVMLQHQFINTREVEMISLRLLQDPVKVSLYGFIELDFSFLYNIIKSITSFIIIMLQLDEQARKSIEVMNLLSSTYDNSSNSFEFSIDNNYSTNEFIII